MLNMALLVLLPCAGRLAAALPGNQDTFELCGRSQY